MVFCDRFVLYFLKKEVQKSPGFMLKGNLQYLAINSYYCFRKFTVYYLQQFSVQLSVKSCIFLSAKSDINNTITKIHFMKNLLDRTLFQKICLSTLGIGYATKSWTVR